MWLGNMCISKEYGRIKFYIADDVPHVLYCPYKELAGMLYVFRGISESDGGDGYTIRRTIEPNNGYEFRFENVSRFIRPKEAFILMIVLEGAIKDAI